jgi:hypothetical protein
MKIAILALVTALAGSGMAYAQQGPHGPETPEQLAARAEVTKACAADMQTICGGQSGRAARECMDQNAAKLAPACKAALEKLPKRPARPDGAGGAGARPGEGQP